MGLSHIFKITNSGLAITCKTNGRQILFSGLDDTEKLKSITPAVGILTDVWIEEATEINYESYKQLTKRLRGIDDGPTLPKRITFSFNPVMKTHWIFKEFFGMWDDSKNLYETDDLLILKTTYKDNNFLTADDIKALESEKDPYYYDVYTLGNWGVLGKVIFKNWHTEDLSDRVKSFDNIYNGLDFGFAEDPNALVRCHLDKKRKVIYVFQEMVQSGMHDDELADRLKQIVGMQYVTCDCAEPKSIDDLCRRGIRAKAAVKGADSVNFGIRFLQGYEIIVDVQCQTIKNELQVYRWQEDKYGNALQKPVDRDNHCIDALRYALEDVMLRDKAKAVRRL
jgi:phage terminase large subunit